MPVGVVGIITPWNFPIAIASWKSFPAIVAGNAVIWKPATETPIMAYELTKIFEEAGLPKGVLNLSYGSAQLLEKPWSIIQISESFPLPAPMRLEDRLQENVEANLKKFSLGNGGKMQLLLWMMPI